MVDTSNMILVIGALLIFGIVLSNTLPIIFSNQVAMQRIEHENMVISMGEELIDEARSKTFNSAMHSDDEDGNEMQDNTWPDDFNEIHENNSGDLTRQNYTAMDHFHGHTETYDTDQGTWEISVELCFTDFIYDPEQDCDPTDQSLHKYMVVHIESMDSDAEARLTSLRTMYED